MRIDCRYSPIFHVLIIVLHTAAISAVYACSLPLLIRIGLSFLLMLAGVQAHLSCCSESNSRIRGFLIWEQYAHLLIGGDGLGRRVKVALPEVSYASEFLLILAFHQLDHSPRSSWRRRHVLVLVPGMISEAQYSRLMGYLRFGTTVM